MISNYEWKQLNEWLSKVNLQQFTGDDQGAVASWYAKINNTPYHKPCSCNPQVFLDWLNDVKRWVEMNRAKFEPQIDLETQG